MSCFCWQKLRQQTRHPVRLKFRFLRARADTVQMINPVAQTQSFERI